MPHSDSHIQAAAGTRPRPLELLAPARDIECGMAAIDHGADAVYIGARRFGARAAAGNSVSDIRRLCEYAHTFLAKVYVTVNTIIYDSETDDTRQLIFELYDAGADAVLVQDMGLLEMELPPIALHASTQTDNRTAEKVAWLAAHGFSRVVLARELSAEEISRIHAAVPQVELEAFVHGALCVSLSGLCYASQYCFGRSANRGECAQFCRMEFDLEDADGRAIERKRHFLSLKDLCRINDLELLADSGVTSFKIEGRLKDSAYVKNVTAAYSQRLDEIVSRNPVKYCRASIGRCRYSFTPNLKKTFNRGFTDYFLHGRRADIASFDTPKAMGEFVGTVKEVRGNSFNVAGTASFANGDGLCFINAGRKLEGFRVNRVEGNRIFPFKIPAGLRAGMGLYRNCNVRFERQLTHSGSGLRTIPVDIALCATAAGFSLTLTVKGVDSVTINAGSEHEEARSPQQDNICRQLTKLGGTPFSGTDVRFVAQSDGGWFVPFPQFNYFIPSSQLAAMRREAVEALVGRLRSRQLKPQPVETHCGLRQRSCYPAEVSYMYNVSNKLARRFYDRVGHGDVMPAFELRQPDKPLLMQCRHCLRFAFGFCVKHGGKRPAWREPLFLKLVDGRRFRLRFDCENCQMNVYAYD